MAVGLFLIAAAFFVLVDIGLAAFTFLMAAAFLQASSSSASSNPSKKNSYPRDEITIVVVQDSPLRA